MLPPEGAKTFYKVAFARARRNAYSGQLLRIHAKYGPNRFLPGPTPDKVAGSMAHHRIELLPQLDPVMGQFMKSS